MIEPLLYDINIALVDKDKSENFFYQRFDDYSHNKIREVIRTVNGFPPEKGFRINAPQVTIDLLNNWTRDAQALADQTGASLNWELLKIINGWVLENL